MQIQIDILSHGWICTRNMPHEINHSEAQNREGALGYLRPNVAWDLVARPGNLSLGAGIWAQFGPGLRPWELEGNYGMIWNGQRQKQNAGTSGHELLLAGLVIPSASSLSSLMKAAKT